VEIVVIVYQAYHKPTHSFYVGKTTQPLWKRRARHNKDANRVIGNSMFHKAIRKYGIEGFEWCVLGYASDAAQLSEMERHWISLIKETGHRMYNLRPGGDGGSAPGSQNHNYGRAMSATAKAKIAQSLRDYYADKPGTMTGRGGESSPFWGRSHSLEARAKISAGNLGRSRPDIVGGLNPSARRILCVTTGEVFETATIAAKKYDSDLSSIIKCCKGKVKSVKGRKFVYSVGQ
jgi:group I intron endonuclease